MELFQLRSFHEVARSGSFSKAAENLNITQPALSRQIVTLEKTVGMNLFNRHNRGVNLTDAGRRLYEYAEDVLKLLDKASKTLKEMQNLESGQLKIGASTTIGNYLLPTWIAKFLNLHPGVDVSLQVGNSETIIEQLVDGLFDIAFVASFSSSPRLCIEPLLEDEILLLVGPNHPLAKTDSFLQIDLSKEVLIFREPGSATKQAVDSLLVKAGIQPTRVITLGNTEAVKRIVMSGMGVTFLSKHTVSLELKTGLLFAPNIPDLRVKRRFLSVYPKGVRLSPAALSFLSHVKRSVAAPVDLFADLPII